MSKNITIAEGGVSKNFTAKKLKTNLQGSGSCTWIPEDEAADYCTFKELKVTANGTYHAEDKNCDGFDTVKVNISADVLPQKTITTNGEYDAMQDDGRVGYAHVTVNVPGGGGGPFTVLFLDDEGNVLKKQENVPYGGYASCTALDGTIVNGLYFKGWNPMPKNVQFNMTCQPVRGDYQIVSGEILDDWETIVADGGAHYPLGSYKTLVMDVPAVPNFSQTLNHVWVSGSYVDGVQAVVDGNTTFAVPMVSIACHVVKVAEGEDGTTSTWMSDGMISLPSALNSDTYITPNNENIHVVTDWGSQKTREWMNEHMLEAMPLPLKNAIKDVNKAYRSCSIAPCSGLAWSTSYQQLDKSSIDRIWVPSIKELDTIAAAMPSYSLYSTSIELEGIDYASVFYPIYGGTPVGTRSIGKKTNQYAHYLNDIALSNSDIVSQNLADCLFGFCL